jgi:hypothetical protein
MSDTGPVLPLYLNREECLVLLEAVWLFERIHAGMLGEQTQQLAQAVIAHKDGPAGTARLDQLMARSSERLPILRSLGTAIAELGDSLDRTQ